ncbi:SDR family oxidoreductase [Shinella sp.]|uniref:SDR family oxidoreductase n=1 Tax=Shinella sp. TaxID=1870904 RepID=UPI0039E4DF8D
MRTYVVTGAASGMGKATTELLRERGEHVIGADLHDADITCDLTTDEGRERLVSETARLSGGTIDGVIAVAGLITPTPATVGVTYFGMIATLEGLRPLLAGSDAPRAVGVSSQGSLLPPDELLVALQLAGDEAGALARAAELAKSPEQGSLIYRSTKVAFARWIRRNAPNQAWAGANIPLNAVAPGLTLTPMIAPYIASAEGRAAAERNTPMPLNGPAEPIVIARLLAWLAGPENSHLCGQVVFADGGSDVVLRGDSTW